MSFYSMNRIGIILYMFAAGCTTANEISSHSVAATNHHIGSDSIPDPDQFILVDQEPTPLNLDEFNKKIGYPLLLREAGIIGKVVFRVLVDEEGNYVRHEVIKSPHPLLTAELNNSSQTAFFTEPTGSVYLKFVATQLLQRVQFNWTR